MTAVILLPSLGRGGADYEGLAYGSSYAHAQDNVCQTA